MSLASDIQRDLLSLLKDLGTTASFTSRSQGTYDPTTSLAAPTDTTVTVTCALLRYSIKDLASSLIQTGDLKALIGATDVNGNAVTAPKPMDKLVAGGVTYQVVDAQPISPGATPWIFIAQVRAFA